MEEKKFIEMYEDMFANFQEQVRLFMVATVEKQQNNESVSAEMFDKYKRNLISTLNTLGKALANFQDESFKGFYQAKIDYNYQYIEDLSQAYSLSNNIKK